MRLAFLHIISAFLLPFNAVFNRNIKVEYFLCDFPFSVAGLQNTIRWRVRGAYKVTLNGIPVNPIFGEFRFVSGSSQKFVLSCNNLKGQVEKSIFVSASHYSRKLDFEYRRLENVHILNFQNLKTPAPQKILVDVNLSRVSQASIAKGLEILSDSFTDKNLEKVCCDSTFGKMHDTLEETRTSYDKNYALLNEQIFKDKKIPADYEKQILDSIKSITH